MKYANLFYFNTIGSLGGVESWFYYLSKLLKDKDVSVVYKTGDDKQLARLRENIRCIPWNGRDHFTCQKLFISYNPEILDFVSAEEIIYVVHSDYESLTQSGQLKESYVKAIASDKRISKYIAVSQTVRDSFRRVTGIAPEVCYNPVILEQPKKFLRLCSAQRMTAEKGRGRIEQLLLELEKYCLFNDVDFQWDIYTKTNPTLNDNKICYRVPDLEVNRLFGYYDYFVALSDNEGFCYSVVEALMRGTPCVVTPCPVFKELGLDQSNSIVLEFNCQNKEQVVEQMFTKNLKSFEYYPPESTIQNLLANEPTTYVKVPAIVSTSPKSVPVQCIKSYFDVEMQQRIIAGNIYSVSWERALQLRSKKLVKFL